MKTPPSIHLALFLTGGLLLLAGCREAPEAAVAPTPAPTPSDAEVERAIRQRTAQDARTTEQQLANQRAAGDEKRVDRQIEASVAPPAAGTASPSAAPVATAAPATALEAAGKSSPSAAEKPPVEDPTETGAGHPAPAPTAPPP